MANITEHAYEDLRTYVVGSWKYLDIQTPTGTSLKRYSEADGLVITGQGTQTISYTVIITGATPEFTGKTVGKSVLYKELVGGEEIATETFSDFIFQSDEDTLTITHKLNVPKVI